MCIVFCSNPQIIFVTFSQVELARYRVLQFIPIVLKLYRCFDHGLKRCTYFEYYSQITFCYFFHKLSLVAF